ncbi:hypothetical protein ACFL27_06860 [candidate division CSSED10-310 bacterium]|uniref:Uncharacterized protein n=1 Tax=candidate division CSSED10-310 bacterium TaxID=2855610 RepID=A0ABV6YV13_UNCC1
MSEIFQIWIAGFLTLCIFSFLYKDNPFYRFAENLYAGLSFGYYIGLQYNTVIIPNVWEKVIQGDYTTVPAVVIGIMLFFRYLPWKKVSQTSTWALALYVGYYVGVTMMQKIHGEIIPQIQATIVDLRPVFTLKTLNNVIVIIGVLSVLIYFYFSRRNTGIIGHLSKIGIWFAMVCFGATFGYTIMGRISLLIGRFQFLVEQWVPSFKNFYQLF